ncbi:MAG TPA: peptidylprolyl isomerase [Cyclobacteriaceae bacterium]|nr:peptidylprolyl isomerase [Cyclobacteriaceae bacterium]
MRFKPVCFLVLGILAACAPKARVEPERTMVSMEPEFLFAIDNDRVLADEFLYTLSKNQHLKDHKSQSITEEDFEQNFELFLNFKLKVKEAERQGLDQSEEFYNEFNIIKEDLKKPYLLENSIQEGELRKAYSRMQEALKASHILIQFPPNAGHEDSIAVLQMAENLRQRAESGEDFNQLAIAYSDDPSVVNSHGDLGYFTSLQMVYPFEDAAYSLQVGEISAPVPTNFGYHIIKLLDRRPNPGQIRVSHILVRIDPSNPASEDRAKTRIANIYTFLQQGEETWEEVVRRFSEDEGTKDTGGLLPWFGVGAIVPEFEEIAFSLTERHEISPPVRTQFGYHIIRLEDTKPIAPYEEMEPLLKSKILRDSRSQLVRSQVIAMQKAKFGFVENEVLVDSLRPIFNQHFHEGIEQLATHLDKRGLLDSTLMTIQAHPLSVKLFLDFIQEDTVVVKTESGNSFDPWYNEYQEHMLAEVEEADLTHHNAEYRMLVKEYREGILLFSLMNDMVWQKALMDSVGQLAYYEEHIDQYQWPERVQGLIVSVEDESQLAKVRRFLQGKVYQKKLKPRLEDQFLNDYPGLFTLEEGIFAIKEHPVLSKLDSQNKNQEVVQDGRRYFILLGDIIPAGPKAFDETRGKVIQDYQKHLDSQLIQSLKEKHVIQINEGEKERISQMVVKK